MDDVSKCSKCKIFSSKSNFLKDISEKDGFNPICKTCVKVYYHGISDKIINYRKQYVKNRKDSDLNFKLACNLRSRTSKAYKAQNVRKTKKTFDLLGFSHSIFQNWIIHQLYGNRTEENYGTVWQIDHCLAVASFNLLDENDMKKRLNWINLRPMHSSENNS